MCIRDRLCVVDPRRSDLGLRLLGPDGAIKVNPAFNIEQLNNPFKYNVIRYILGVLEGPGELKGRDPLDVDMMDNNAIYLDKMRRDYPELAKRIEDEVEEKILMSFALYSSSGIEQNIKSMSTGDMFNIFQSIDSSFSATITGEEVRGDDEVVVGEVIAQACNIGVALINIEKFNSKPFTLMSIAGYEAYMWKSQYKKPVSTDKQLTMCIRKRSNST
eukprot:TRINITY_DN8677_c0_g1_i8.p1 TRINITY_DN8677_c0_g1~~TRINITY_DN8677_c0_g1_i8.p1  ORF type:complete len:217 (+),score=23.59 TRINITY_DN8677_c0_g1_i8:72-722(+)